MEQVSLLVSVKFYIFHFLVYSRIQLAFAHYNLDMTETDDYLNNLDCNKSDRIQKCDRCSKDVDLLIKSSVLDKYFDSFDKVLNYKYQCSCGSQSYTTRKPKYT